MPTINLTKILSIHNTSIKLKRIYELFSSKKRYTTKDKIQRNIKYYSVKNLKVVKTKTLFKKLYKFQTAVQCETKSYKSLKLAIRLR